MITWREVVGGIIAWWALLMLGISLVLAPALALQYATIAAGLLLFAIYLRLGRK